MFKRLFLEYWHLQCYLLLLCFKIAHGAHSLNQDPTGLGGHEVWVHNPFLEGSLSILGCDSAPGWSVQKGRAAGATESMVPRAGGLEHKGQTGPGARQPHWPHYSISCHLVNIFSLSTFFFFFFSKISRFFANGNFKNSNDSLFMFPSIHLLCDIQDTQLSPTYTPLSALLFFFLPSTSHHWAKSRHCSMKMYSHAYAVLSHMFLGFCCMTQGQRKRILGLSEPITTRWSHSQLLSG